MKDIRILYVEDDLEFGRLTKILLDQEEFYVELARDLEKARTSFQAKRPDLLLVDLDLAGLKTGLTLIQEIKKAIPWFPIVVYSSHVDPATVVATLNLGVMDHIGKDCEKSVFVAKLQNIVRQTYHRTSGQSPVYELSPITTFNYNNCTLTINNKPHKLPGKDADMLNILCVHCNEWIAPKEICFFMWKIDKNIENLKRYAVNLRKHLAPDTSLSIQNRHGGYYMLKTPLTL